MISILTLVWFLIIVFIIGYSNNIENFGYGYGWGYGYGYHGGYYYPRFYSGYVEDVFGNINHVAPPHVV